MTDIDQSAERGVAGAWAVPGSRSHEQVRYTWTAEVPDSYVVVAVEGMEELNRPYCLVVELAMEDSFCDSDALLGVSAQLRLERSELHQRSFCGLVRKVSATRALGDRQHVIVELVPALWTLGLTRRTRIFQDRSAIEIVESVLAEGLGKYERLFDAAALDRSRYQVREYCVQYQETDLDFVHRLLEEEGIGYSFEHDEKERLVLTDKNVQFRRVATMGGGPVPFEPHDLVIASEEPITAFHPAKQLSSTRFTARDHDWTRGWPTLEATRALEDVGCEHEVYEHGLDGHVSVNEDDELLASLMAVATSALHTAVVPRQYVGAIRSEIDLPGVMIAGFTSDDTERRAGLRHELLLRDRTSAKGTSHLVGLSAGNRFELVGHPTLGVDGEYYVTKVIHTSGGSETARETRAVTSGAGETHLHYANTFECRPVATPWRPDRRTRKPCIYGLQTATVTTPVGMDVHTDQHGRIKVKFDWDRNPTSADANDSCWIRVTQTWAGPGYPGFIFVPRSGMEVVVSFLDGDPDRPIVVACVHNGRNPAPSLLPLQATKSMIRTRTVPHGAGYNELSFEDAMGAERVHLRAERDFTQHIRNDRSAEIERHDTTVVRGNKSELVEGASVFHARKGRSAVVAGIDTVTTEGPSFRTSRGPSTSTLYAGEEVLCVGGDRYVRVDEGHHHLLVKGPIQQESAEEVVIKVGNAELSMTSDQVQISIGGSRFTLTAQSVVINGKTMPAPQGSPPPPSAVPEPRHAPPPPPSMDEPTC